MRELIPTFEVGQRVRVWNRPVEYQCPSCGAHDLFKYKPSSSPGTSFTGTITKTWQTENGCWCSDCGCEVPFEGWYEVIDYSDTWRGGVPYTLIEPIEEGELD